MTLDEILDWQEQMGTRLRRYGGTLITVAGCDTVQPVDANDNARRRFHIAAAAASVKAIEGAVVTANTASTRLAKRGVRRLRGTSGVDYIISTIANYRSAWRRAASAHGRS